MSESHKGPDNMGSQLPQSAASTVPVMEPRGGVLDARSLEQRIVAAALAHEQGNDLPWVDLRQALGR